jgi:hypothetical protein
MNVGNIASIKSMAQEAMETAAQTKAEAAKGDQQAIRKLALTQAQKNAESAPQTAETPKGRLNAKA